jgi:hypothetical protein
MGLGTKNLNQTAVYWARNGFNSEGAPSFDDPVEVDCRWEDRAERFLSPSGEELISSAVVMVSRDMDAGDYLFLGDLDDLDSSQDALTQDGAWPVRAFGKIPGIKATDFQRVAWLSR